jgi:hypothetical protein
VQATGGSPTPEFTASIEAKVAEVESNAAQVAVGPWAAAEPWLRWATDLARRHKLRVTVLTGAPIPRFFRHRAVEINNSYIKRGDKRLRISSLGTVTMDETPGQAAALAETRRQYRQAWDDFDRLNHWPIQQRAN